MSRAAKKKRYRATVETPGHFSGAEMVTITGTGTEVFALAYVGALIAQRNGAEPLLHFYVEGREVPWRDIVERMEAELHLSLALKRISTLHNYEDIPI